MNEYLMITGWIVAPVISALVAYHYREWREKINITTKLPERFVDNWFATWQTNSASENPWSTERVKVSITGKKLHFSNYDNDNEYQWEGDGEIFNNLYVIGYWRSKKNPTSSGTFTLCLSNQAEYLVGFFLGPNRGGLHNYGAFILAKSKEKLASGKRELALMGPSLHEILATPSRISG